MADGLLLHSHDLPVYNAHYFERLTKEGFQSHFGALKLKVEEKNAPNGGQISRLTVILPLRLKDRENFDFIPIPFIVDTGAPMFAYFGRGAMRKLLHTNAIIRDNDTYELQGNLIRGEHQSDDNQIVYELPDGHEVKEIKNKNELEYDPRANLLGLPGMKKLGMLNLIE